MATRDFGLAGEKIAADYLRENGYKILDKNYTSKYLRGPLRGEVDIVAAKNKTFYFVEVKTARYQGDRSFFRPENRVNEPKKQRLIKTAQFWLASHKFPLDSKWQIDILAINLAPETNKKAINHFQNITF